MDWLRILLSRCIAFFGAKKLDDELDEELLSHIELAFEENLQRGMSEQDARRVALLKFGGVAQIKETYRLQRGLPFLDALAQDIRFGARQMKHAPGFAVVAVLTLALGIGANTAVFTLTHALLLSTLPVRDPGEVVRLAVDVSATETNGHNAPLNLPIIEAIEKQSRSFHGIFAWCVYDFPFKDGSVNSGIHGAIQAAKHDGGRLWLDTFARLNPGVSRAQASVEMNTLFPSILDATVPPALRHLPVIEKARLEVKAARTGWSKLRSQYTEPLLVLQLMVAAVLLICCANLSGLFLARASARQQEFAIRGALGASRLRLMRQLFVECLMLALPGAVLGVWLAWLTGPWILHMLGNAEAEQAISMRPNLTVLSVTIACAVFCALLFGMAPAWTAGRTSVEVDLRSSHPRLYRGGAGLRNFFVPFQLALSLTLVVVAGLLCTTIARLLTENSGYRTDNVIFVLTDFLRIQEKGEALVSLYRRMAERMEELPGVEQASVAAVSPLLGDRWTEDFIAAENAGHAGPVEAMENVIAAHYFSVVGIPMLSGRDLQNNDSDRNSCIVSQAAARLYFAGTSALGKTLRNVIHNRRTGTDTFRDCQIVGIVQDTKYDSLRESPPPIVYIPITVGEGGFTNAGATLFFVIHARSVAAAKSAYLATLHEMAPASPEIAPVEFNQAFLDSVARERLLSVLSGFFALLGLLLSGIGIYGLVAWNVTRRTSEIGLRMALGATRIQVFTLVIRQVTSLLFIGLLVGGLAALFAARAIRSFLFEIQPGNPSIFTFSALLLTLIGLFAALLPAQRAVSIDPMQALKTE